MSSQDTLSEMEVALNLIDEDINAALELFNSCIKKQAECMKKHVRTNGKKRNDKWYDLECTAARRTVRRLLRKCRKHQKDEDRKTFCTGRTDYKKTN